MTTMLPPLSRFGVRQHPGVNVVGRVAEVALARRTRNAWTSDACETAAPRVARDRPVANQGSMVGGRPCAKLPKVSELATSTITALMRLGALAGRSWEETLQEILLVTSGTLAVE